MARAKAGNVGRRQAAGIEFPIACRRPRSHSWKQSQRARLRLELVLLPDGLGLGVLISLLGFPGAGEQAGACRPASRRFSRGAHAVDRAGRRSRAGPRPGGAQTDGADASAGERDYSRGRRACSCTALDRYVLPSVAQTGWTSTMLARQRSRTDYPRRSQCLTFPSRAKCVASAMLRETYVMRAAAARASFAIW